MAIKMISGQIKAIASDGVRHAPFQGRPMAWVRDGEAIRVSIPWEDLAEDQRRAFDAVQRIEDTIVLPVSK